VKYPRMRGSTVTSHMQLNIVNILISMVVLSIFVCINLSIFIVSGVGPGLISLAVTLILSYACLLPLFR
jgi:hypothetical protein